MATNIYEIDPITDPRWPTLLTQNSRASVFHTPDWLRALQKTYGYDPVVFSTSNGEALSNGVVFCGVNSWLTGKRLVSLPFSDHCQPLANWCELEAILQHVEDNCHTEMWKYVELRPRADILECGHAFTVSESFAFHVIDLKQELSDIYRAFHESCVRRKIKRGEREGLTYESGRSVSLLNKFHDLLVLTRQRHKLPPQPETWFRNLLECLGNRITIHLLSRGAEPIASMITLSFKRSLVYKYGCSDARFHNLGGMALLFWKVIQQGKEDGAEELDLGRSAPNDFGLIAFKEHLGAVRSVLTYYRSPASAVCAERPELKLSWARQALAYLPQLVVNEAGRLLYRHLG